MADKIFVDGLFAKEANEKVKHFIPARLSFKVAEFIPFLNAHAVNGYVNVDIKIGKSGKMYAELDTWQPNKKVEEVKGQIDSIFTPEEKARIDADKQMGSGKEEIIASDIPF